MKNNIILTEKNFNKLKEQVKKNSEKEIIFSSNDDELNRKVLEKLKIQILLINQEGRKDFQKQRNSGLNHVLAKIAKKNNIQIGINFDEIVEAHPRVYPDKSSSKISTRGRNIREKANILARIKQNIILCNKNKVGMKFIMKKHQRNISDLKSLGLVLGMPTGMTKEID